MRITYRLGLVYAFTIALTITLSACAHASVEVVESVPLETNLAVPGVQDTQSAWLEIIGAAKSTLDMEEFYISGGDSLAPVLAAMKAAALRGVKVRILLDAGFYKTYPDDANALAKNPNVQLKTVDFSKNGGIMHAKYFVVDGQKAYVGSANCDWLALSHIHEVGLKIDDSALASGIESVFNLDWGVGSPEQFSTPISSPNSTSTLYASPINDLPATVPQTLDAIVNLMKNTHHTLQIQMYEYAIDLYGSTTKWKMLDDAIRATAARGVKVQMLVDKTAMKAGSADLKALAKVPNIDVRVITIPEWSGGPLQYARVAHSKYLISDSQSVWIGSENWTGDYFTSSRNVGLITTDSGVLAKIGQIYSRVWNSGYTSAP